MSNWFSRLFGAEATPTPQGFRRIRELPCSDDRRDFAFKILDWRLAPNPPHEVGSAFLWLEVDGERAQFFLAHVEAVHFVADALSRASHVRIVKSRGGRCVLPINPRNENLVRKLPAPPTTFPPPLSS